LKFDKTLKGLVDSSEQQLSSRALEVSANIREFIQRYRRQDELNREEEFQDSRSSPNSTETWDRYRSRDMRVSDERNSEYERRFKIDAIMLRDELRARIPDYTPAERHHDLTYEHPTNYFGFEEVASDLERMAKYLTDPTFKKERNND